MNLLSIFDIMSNNCTSLGVIGSIYSIYIIQQPDPETRVMGFISDVNM